MKGQYITPELDLAAFNCPHCHVYSQQDWFYLRGGDQPGAYGRQHGDERFRISYCARCGQNTIWYEEKIVFPQTSLVEPANPDLPEDIIHDYNEAASVINLSPRSAAALLRLAIQKLCKVLGEPGKDINNDIKSLVQKGLPSKVQEALDSVRVIGNEAVHPGELDIKDNREIANKLFRLVNFITSKLITEPREIDDLYKSLPENKLEGIKNRDKK